MKDEEDRLEVVREELEEREREIEERERETAKSGERFAFLPVCWCSIGLLQVFSLAPASLRSKILRNLSQGRVQFPPLPLKRLRHLENHVTPCASIRHHARRIASGTAHHTTFVYQFPSLSDGGSRSDSHW